MRFIVQVLIASAALSFNAKAQNPTYKHSVGVGLEHVGLDAPDGGGNRYLIRYTRHLHNDRFLLAGNAGYVKALNRRYLGLNNYYVDGRRRERITADFTAAFDFIRHPRHAFRLGIGPSLWYRQDELLDGVTYTVNVTTNEVSNVRAEWRQIKEVNFGYNVLVEYEYAFTERLLASAKLKFFDSRRAGPSSIYGVGLGYRLP